MIFRTRLKFITLIIFTWLVIGCTSLSRVTTPSFDTDFVPTQKHCQQFIQEINDSVKRHHKRDTQEYLIPGFPYLRTTRFLASLNSQEMNSQETEYWLLQMRELDLLARQLELQNLNHAESGIIFSRYQTCSNLLIRHTLDHPTLMAELKTSIKIPDNYQSIKRFFGLYPLTSFFVKRQIGKLQDEIKEIFNTPIEQISYQGQLWRYQPETFELPQDEITRILQHAIQNPLKIPQASTDDMSRLFAHYAPVWEVDTVTDDDRIGAIRFNNNDQPMVDVKNPLVYQYYGITQLEGENLLQLNYTFWFAARPAQGPFDIYSGRLDGITFRLTLNQHGKVIIADSMHNCGCYHKFYPSQELKINQSAVTNEPEPPLIAQTLPTLSSGNRYVVRISTVSHYTHRILLASNNHSPNSNYTLVDYTQLRSLPLENGSYKSLFAENGLVTNTKRGERWLLWPMGVLSAGAMRQMGHHAIAFVGKRHFDDPDLISRYFIYQ
jgi:hypothetical protein